MFLNVLLLFLLSSEQHPVQTVEFPYKQAGNSKHLRVSMQVKNQSSVTLNLEEKLENNQWKLLITQECLASYSPQELRHSYYKQANLHFITYMWTGASVWRRSVCRLSPDLKQFIELGDYPFAKVDNLDKSAEITSIHLKKYTYPHNLPEGFVDAPFYEYRLKYDIKKDGFFIVSIRAVEKASLE